VRLPPNIADKRRFCGTALVEFSSEQDTQDILRQSLVYAGADLVLIPKSDFDCQRENMIKQLGKSESHNEFRRGQIVKFALKWIASEEKVTNKEKPSALKNKIKEKEDKETGIADREKENGDNSCASLCKDNTDQLVVPPWNNSNSVSSEVLKDLFQRFGSVEVSCNTFCQTTNPLKSDC